MAHAPDCARLLHVQVHQCTSAPVHQCTSAPVHQCISAPVHQCISAPVRRAVGAHGAGCGARARVGWTPQLRTSSDSGEEVTTTPPASTSPPVTGTHIESLPEAREAVSGTSKRRRHSLAEGTRAGASDVAAWRDVVLVSFWGTSPQRHRVLDVYDRRSLAYRGSVLFPYKIDHIAVHGDTLALTGEVEDEPVVGVFLLGRRGGAASARSGAPTGSRQTKPDTGVHGGFTGVHGGLRRTCDLLREPPCYPREPPCQALQLPVSTSRARRAGSAHPGLLHRNPTNRAKAASSDTSSHPCSIASAACHASETTLPMAPECTSSP